MTARAHHLSIATRMVRREADGAAYREVLEHTLGLTLGETLISTAEHVAPFNRPATLSFVLPQLALQHPVPLRSIVILAGALIPMDNAHYPRGFYLPEDEGSHRRFNIFPSRERKTVPLLQPPIRAVEHRDAAIFFGEYPWLEPFFDDISAFASYAHQISACMECMAYRWFPPASCSGFHVLPLEDTARKVLATLLERCDPLLDRLIFDQGNRKRLALSLKGSLCAWDDTKGSFLFWASFGGKLYRMKEDCGELVSACFRLPIERLAIAQALRAGRIWPGVFMSLLAVSYLPNLPIGGGPNQYSYYPQMTSVVEQLTRTHRSNAVSVPGYLALDMRYLRPRASHTGLMPANGTGLALTAEPLDPNWIAMQLDRFLV